MYIFPDSCKYKEIVLFKFILLNTKLTSVCMLDSVMAGTAVLGSFILPFIEAPSCFGRNDENEMLC